ncbi:MAG: YHYH protein [Okeania sp. SIO2C9]|uniref:YHYH protein n=1 Tax=Okeania sp. SIO2C9 TaxID=2607791 RepID=UPI0013C0FF94|nr:YHYH protein [Okeania sp. SIO2C9]NEQ75808.1 YHYH protein [Okeania sp. SIO2C9]
MKLKYIYIIMLVLFLIGFSPNNSSAIGLNNTSNPMSSLSEFNTNSHNVYANNSTVRKVESSSKQRIKNRQNSKDITDVILKKRKPSCADYVKTYTSSVKDLKSNQEFKGNLSVSVSGDKCIFTTNAIPNYDFNSSQFVTDVSAQNLTLEVTTNPQQASKNTELSLATDNAIFLNGVKLDLLSAGCYGVGDGKIGCSDMEQPWRFDPMSSLNDFQTDSHNAHTQPSGIYHYHGSPVALFDSENAIVSPVIGFAADGFPIFGSYFDDNGTVRKAKSSYQLKEGERQEIKCENPGGIYDDNGTVRKAKSSYQLKEGERQEIKCKNPGGIYDGSYRDDYEYVAELGDLDECNGMTINGVYGYFVTDSYPWVMGCFKGTPDSSFNKQKSNN